MLQAALERDRRLRSRLGPPRDAAEAWAAVSDETTRAPPRRTEACWLMRKLLHPEHKERYGRKAPEEELKDFEEDAPPLTATQRTAAFLKLVLMDRFRPTTRPGRYVYKGPSDEMRAFRAQLSAELTGDSVVSLAGLLRGWRETSSDLRTGYVAYRSADAAPLDESGRRARAESALHALRHRYLALVVAGDDAKAYRVFWKRGVSEKPRPVCTHLVDERGVREEELSYDQAVELVQRALTQAESAAYPNFSSGGAIFVGSPQTWKKLLDAKPAWLLGEKVHSTGDDWVKPGLDILDERARSSRGNLSEWAAKKAEALAPALAPGTAGVEEDVYYVLVDASPEWRTDLQRKASGDVELSVKAHLNSVMQNAERTGNALRAYLGKKAAAQTYDAALRQRPAPPPEDSLEILEARLKEFLDAAAAGDPPARLKDDAVTTMRAVLRLHGEDPRNAEAALDELVEAKRTNRRRERQRQLEQLVANAIATAEEGRSRTQTVQYLRELLSLRGEDASGAEASYDQMIQRAPAAAAGSRPAMLAELDALLREAVDQGDADGLRKRRAIEILGQLGGREPARDYAQLLKKVRGDTTYPVTAAAVTRSNLFAASSAAPREPDRDFAQRSMLDEADEILALQDDA